MTLPTNDDISDRELSIEELEAIAAGSLLGDIWNFLTGPALHALERGAFWVANGGRSAPRLR